MSNADATISKVDPPKKPRRRWRRLAVVLVTTLIVLVVLGPTIFSFAPCLNFVLKLATSKVHGTITTEGASLGWLSRPVVYGLQILPEAGPPLVYVPRAGCDRTLLQIALQPSELGTIDAEKPEVRLVVEEQGPKKVVNFAEVFAPPPELAGKPSPFLNWLKGRHIEAEVNDLTIHWLTPGAAREWSMDRISVSGELKPAWMSESGAPELHVNKQKILDHRELTPGMFKDLLQMGKFIIPTLAKASRMEGSISFELDECQLPLDKEKIKQGHLSGALTFHSVEVSDDVPIINTIAAFLKLPTEVQLTHESVVEFEMREGRVYHHGVDFGLSGVRVTTSGSVGLDQTLDLVAEVHVSTSSKFKEDRPLLGALAGQVLRLPIGGTLEKPEINLQGFGKSALDLAKGTLDELKLDGDRPVAELLKLLRDRNLLGAPATGEPGGDAKNDGDKPPTEGVGEQILEGVGRFLKNRRDRRAERKNGDGQK